ncbi:MAG: hypothetical protein KDB53_17655, partial [Planctomycetes bacterium]|nr:hypothetical protein [Planctomycetota bacterium]
MGGQAKHLMRHLPALATVALAAWLAARSAAGASSPVASAILLALVGAGVFFAAWRLVQNRAVAAAAGVLALVHPTLASLAASSDADLALGAVTAAAWALVPLSRRRARSARFPNRSPAYHDRAVLAALLAAALLAPGGWTASLAVLTFVVVFAREPGRFPGVDTRTLAAFAGLAVLGFLFDVVRPDFLDLHDLAANAFGDRPAALLHPGLADRPMLRIVVVAGLCFGLLFAAFDLLSAAGTRRTVVRWLGAAALWVTVLWFASLATQASGIRLVEALMVLVPAAALPVLAWRLVVAAVPSDELPSVSQGPVWSQLRAALPLPPWPDLQPLPAPPHLAVGELVPEAEQVQPFSPALEAALEGLAIQRQAQGQRLGVSAPTWPEERVAALLDGEPSMLAI